LLNLAVNARDAMPQGGRLSIATREVLLDDEDAERDGGLAPGAYVLVAVSDTGVGMPREVVARAFEPFFTTKETGKGTGLGLSMVYGFAKQSGGHVSLRSDLGYGTAVTLYLPQAKKTAIAEVRAPRAQPTGTEAVLLVEDDNEVRAATTKLLSGLGYRVIEAADAAEALSLLEREGDLQLLFTDVVLGHGMSGPELAREARRLRPDLKILFVGKPFRKEELAQKLRIALDDREK
jgi:CheY-like chemotaxis protein